MDLGELIKRGLSLAVCLWIGGCVINEALRSWSPVAKKCSVAVLNEYESIKERMLVAKIKSMRSDEQTLSERENKKREEAELKKRQDAAEAERRRLLAEAAAAEARSKQVMAFAERESPRLINVYRQLKAEIETQNAKIVELKKVLNEYGFNVEKDADVARLDEQLETLRKAVREIDKQMINAYVAAKKFEAAPVRKEFDAICRKAFEDGVMEAESAIARYNELKKTK